MYLIKITKRKWDRLNDSDWLQANEIQADPLGDLRPFDGRLSIWDICEDSSKLDEIIAALVLNTNDWNTFEYGLFDRNIPKELGITIECIIGKTPIPEANEYHRELIHLTTEMYTLFVNNVFLILKKERLYKDDIEKKVRIVASKIKVNEIYLNKKILPLFQNLMRNS